MHLFEVMLFNGTKNVLYFENVYFTLNNEGCIESTTIYSLSLEKSYSWIRFRFRLLWIVSSLFTNPMVLCVQCILFLVIFYFWQDQTTKLDTLNVAKKLRDFIDCLYLFLENHSMNRVLLFDWTFGLHSPHLHAVFL